MTTNKPPTHGVTKLGHKVHAKTSDHLADHSAYARFNKRAAVAITKAVGSMTAAYLFCLLALCSLPAILSMFAAFHGDFPKAIVKVSIVALVSWIAQSFLQLVLLPVIIVGQNVQAEASDARAAKTFEDTERIVDLLDTDTTGGLSIVVKMLHELHEHVEALSPKAGEFTSTADPTLPAKRPSKAPASKKRPPARS